MNVMDRLFGRKARTSAAISAALSTARDALADAQGRAASAADRRKAAIASGDRSAAITAESERAAAEIDSEIAAGEVAGLDAGYVEAVKAEQAAARAALIASFVQRRAALDDRFSDWRRAAAVLAAVLSEAATLSRDVREAGAEREVEGLPSVPRGLPMNGEALADFSRWLGDSLSSPPAVSESPKEREAREHQAERKRKQAEAEEARQAKLAAEREEGRAVREAEDARERERERNPYRATWRDHLSDAAR